MEGAGVARVVVVVVVVVGLGGVFDVPLPHCDP